MGETLTADTSGIADADGLSSVQYEYQWLADDTEIAGATSLTYTLVDADEGKAIKVEASFTDDEGNNETLTSGATDAVAAAPTPNSPATGAPTINGTAQVGQTLTADTSGITDADGLANATFSYQWLADDSEIAGASGLTYTLTDSEESKAITVQVSFTDDAGNEENVDQRGHGCGGGRTPDQFSRHRSANHQWHGAGERNADREHVGHRRTRTGLATSSTSTSGLRRTPTSRERPTPPILWQQQTKARSSRFV